MTLNVPIDEFHDKWSHEGDNIYTDGTLFGELVYEDDNYFVLKLLKR
jgi:hypothetical protein